MKKVFIDRYSSLGINISTNKILIDLLNKLDFSDKIFTKQFELFHMDFLLGLSEIKEFDENSFNKYIKRINGADGNLNFWGEKFEIFIYSKLIKSNLKFITNLKRGTDGIEPDLVLNFNNNQIGIELTTLKFTTPPKTKEIILSKITDKILEKNKKCYSNKNCALIIDITNIIAYEKLLNIELKLIFKELFNGFDYLGKKINFGMIILCNSVFKLKQDGNLIHRLEARIGLIRETETRNRNLIEFLNLLFNNFKSDNDYNLKFYHLNI